MRGPYDYSGHFNNDMCMGYRVGADGKQVMSTGTTVSCAHKCLHEKEFKGPSGAECSGVSLGGIRALGSVACD